MNSARRVRIDNAVIRTLLYFISQLMTTKLTPLIPVLE